MQTNTAYVTIITVIYKRLTFVGSNNDDFTHVLLTSKFQGVHEQFIDTVRLVHDNVKQLFSCLDGLAVFGLNRLQLIQCERVTLKHVASDALCV